MERKTVGGFARGILTVSPFVDDPTFKDKISINFQNENLVASTNCFKSGLLAFESQKFGTLKVMCLQPAVVA